MNKYNARRTKLDGITFHSKKEAELNMSPCSSPNNISYVSGVYIKHICNFFICFVFRQRTYFKHVYFFQLRKIVFTSLSRSIYTTIFVSSIFEVIRLCSCIKMFRINTGRIVAFVTYVQAIRDRAIMILVRITMSRYFFIIYSKHPIISIRLISYPQPTIFSFFDFTPKSINWYSIPVKIKTFFRTKLDIVFSAWTLLSSELLMAK